MKNAYRMLFAVLLSFLFILNVEAAGKFEMKLSCPTNAVLNQNISCTVYGLATGENIKKLNVEITTNNYISYLNNNIDKNMNITNNYVKIGTVNLKTKNTSGNARVTVSIKATTENDTGLQTKFKNAYINIESNINTLSDLKVDGKTISGFDKDKASYTITTKKSSAIISATPTSNKATVTGTGTKKLECGSNVFTIKTTAENGKYKNYTIGITRECDKNVYLKNIATTAGTLKPKFDKNTTEYTIELDKQVEKITITGIKSSNTQIITGDVTDKELKFGNNKVSIKVTTETGETKTYNVNVIRKDNRDENNYLSSLSLSVGVINFEKNKLNYEVKVNNNVENVEILAKAEKETSKISIIGNKNLAVGENTISIKVTSENGKERVYTIKATRLNEGEKLESNANIKNIVVKNYDLKFKYDKEEYKLIIDKETSLEINVLMEDENASYEIIGNENLKDGSIIKIITKTNDGNSKTYTIEIIKSNYTIYYVIAVLLLLLLISIPILVYFKSVKGKKKILDVNGYEVGKGYEEKDYSRRIISNTNINQTIEKPLQNNEEYNNLNNFNNNTPEYIPSNNDTKCPNCGRELLGEPSECPYCRMQLR